MNSRKLALTLHRVIGILVGLLLVISGLTGSSIVFQEEIDRPLNALIVQVVPGSKMRSLCNACIIFSLLQSLVAHPGNQPVLITPPVLLLCP